MQTLETVIIRGNNNFGLVRLITASLVIINHASALFPNGYHMPETGYLRLWIFFFLSGLFITSSFSNAKTYSSFIIMRVCRLWPALIVCTFITVFILGPIVTTVSLKEYFTTGLTWKYLWCNSVIYNIKYFLPGVFTANHFSGVVNNPLWTIPMELKCYGFVFVLGYLGFFNNRITVVAGFAIITAYLFFTKMNFWEITSSSIVLYILFMFGSVSYFFKKYIYIDYRIALFLLVLLFAAKYFELSEFVTVPLIQLALIYSAVTIGASKIFKKINLPGDYSYGMYVYGFLVQQTIAHYLPEITPLFSLVLTMPVVVVLGGLSWHYVENPSLKFGKRFAKRTYDNPAGWYSALRKSS